jgi:hypothetical protein
MNNLDKCADIGSDTSNLSGTGNFVKQKPTIMVPIKQNYVNIFRYINCVITRYSSLEAKSKYIYKRDEAF